MPLPAMPLRTLTACLLAGALLAGCLDGKSPQPPPRIPKPKIKFVGECEPQACAGPIGSPAGPLKPEPLKQDGADA